jgi:hypothetical protein
MDLGAAQPDDVGATLKSESPILFGSFFERTLIVYANRVLRLSYGIGGDQFDSRGVSHTTPLAPGNFSQDAAKNDHPL